MPIPESLPSSLFNYSLPPLLHQFPWLIQNSPRSWTEASEGWEERSNHFLELSDVSGPWTAILDGDRKNPFVCLCLWLPGPCWNPTGDGGDKTLQRHFAVRTILPRA